MATSSAKTSPLSRETIRELVVAAVAKVNAASVEDVERDAELQGGDLAVKSHFATAVVASLEDKLGVVLADQDDLDQFTRTSINSLTRLIEQKQGGRPKRVLRPATIREVQASKA